MYETKAERDALFSSSGKYVEERLLNEVPSGFGWAILVRDFFNEPCVAKVPNSPAATTELRNEAEILAKIRRLEHPNLVQLRDVEKCQVAWAGTTEERLFLILQFGGRNLRSQLGRIGMRGGKDGGEYVYTNGRAFALDAFFQIALQMADGLKALHKFEVAPGERIVHRDIKPENILIDDAGRVRITDFGISRVVERLTQSFTAGGTAPYLAPEYLHGRLNASCDVYSLGIILYEMATGAFPFRMHADKFFELPRPPHEVNAAVPRPLSDVIMRALAYDPSAPRGQETRGRYVDGGELLDDLQRCRQKLFPVPANYELIEGPNAAPHLFRDKPTGRAVRIFLYDVPEKDLALYRLAAMTRQKVPQVLSPMRLFDADSLVGVVAPTAAWDDATVASGAGASGGPVPERPPRRRRPPLPEPAEGAAGPKALERVARLAEILRPLHSAGMCHGCLTPFTARLVNDDWQIDDLWAAQFIGGCERQNVFAPDDPVLLCLAPEVAAWSASPTLAADVYGLGMIAYAHLTGQIPATAATVEMRSGAADDPAARHVWPASVPLRWRRIVSRALSGNPAERPATPEEFARELTSCRWPDDWFESLFDSVRRDHAAGRIAEAYDALDAAQRTDPGNPGVHHVRGELFLRDGSPDYALDENSAAYDIDPSPPVCWLQGRCLLALQRPAEAEAFVREGLAARDAAEGWALLADCLAAQGRHDEADVARRKSHDQDSGGGPGAAARRHDERRT